MSSAIHVDDLIKLFESGAWLFPCELQALVEELGAWVLIAYQADVDEELDHQRYMEQTAQN